MIIIEAHEAETHFDELLKKVEQGERVTITRHGVPVAHMVPFQDEFADSAAAMAELCRFREEHHITLGDGITIRELIEEGRRW